MPLTVNPFPDIEPGELGSYDTPDDWTTEIGFQNRLGKAKLEAQGHNQQSDSIAVVSTGNAFVATAGLAYARHLPLVFGPDEVWLCITQGLAQHINQHAEELRHHFVQHQGKQLIEILRDEFVRGSPDNDWPGCFDEFAQQIKQYIGPKHDLIVADFTTTGPVERAASNIVLMDAMQQYFSYQLTTLSGYPSITILGDQRDWENMRERVEQFAEFDLEWWTTGLLQVLDNIVNTFEGAPDPHGFWRSFYRRGGGSGGPYVDGWIHQLFPYLNDRRSASGYRQNPAVLDWEYGRTNGMGGIAAGDFPNGLSSVPFVWSYYGEALPYRLVAGLTATQQLDNQALRPVIGWGVHPDEKSE